MAEERHVLVNARAILADLFENKAWAQGRIWGRKKRGPVDEGNPYKGSNITMIIDEELVSISADANGVLIIHEFVQKENTVLGRMVKTRLERAGLPFKRTGEVED